MMMDPGYTGLIPESQHNALACREASAIDQPRQDGETSTMLFTLDQYSRQRVPLYTGHRPTALSNLSVVEPAHGPTLQTTQVTSRLSVQATIHDSHMHATVWCVKSHIAAHLCTCAASAVRPMADPFHNCRVACMLHRLTSRSLTSTFSFLTIHAHVSQA